VLLAMQASLRTNAIIPLISAPDKLGFDRERARDGQWLVTTKRVPFRREHLLDSFLSFVRTIGLPTGEVRWDLPIDERHERLARTRVPDAAAYFVVHPFSSKPERDWPVERYAEVIETVKEGFGLEALLTGGSSPREIHQGRLLEDYATTDVINLIGQTSAKELAALLGGARFVLAPDTAAVHIATALGTPVVGLYAVAPSWLSGPYRRMDWVVDRHALAVETLLGVDVESAPWRTRVHSDRAMRLITVDEVMERVGALLEELRHEGTD
jgi:heptosyltransferase I